MPENKVWFARDLLKRLRYCNSTSVWLRTTFLQVARESWQQVQIACKPKLHQEDLTCLAMAQAVFLLSPVKRMTRMPMRSRVCTARAASDLTVSAIANMPSRWPSIAARMAV